MKTLVTSLQILLIIVGCSKATLRILGFNGAARAVSANLVSPAPHPFSKQSEPNRIEEVEVWFADGTSKVLNFDKAMVQVRGNHRREVTYIKSTFDWQLRRYESVKPYIRYLFCRNSDITKSYAGAVPVRFEFKYAGSVSNDEFICEQ